MTKPTDVFENYLSARVKFGLEYREEKGGFHKVSRHTDFVWRGTGDLVGALHWAFARIEILEDENPVGKKSKMAIEAFSDAFGLDEVDMFSNNRDVAVIRPRQYAMCYCHHIMEMTRASVYRAFKRDHTSVDKAIEEHQGFVITEYIKFREARLAAAA